MKKNYRINGRSIVCYDSGTFEMVMEYVLKYGCPINVIPALKKDRPREYPATIHFTDSRDKLCGIKYSLGNRCASSPG